MSANIALNEESQRFLSRTASSYRNPKKVSKSFGVERMPEGMRVVYLELYAEEESVGKVLSGPLGYGAVDIEFGLNPFDGFVRYNRGSENEYPMYVMLSRPDKELVADLLSEARRCMVNVDVNPRKGAGSINPRVHLCMDGGISEIYKLAVTIYNKRMNPEYFKDSVKVLVSPYSMPVCKLGSKDILRAVKGMDVEALEAARQDVDYNMVFTQKHGEKSVKVEATSKERLRDIEKELGF